MIVAIIQFENPIPVAPDVGRNSLMTISTINPLHPVDLVAHLHEAPVADPQAEVLVADQVARPEAHLGAPAVAHPRASLGTLIRETFWCPVYFPCINVRVRRSN